MWTVPPVAVDPLPEGPPLAQPSPAVGPEALDEQQRFAVPRAEHLVVQAGAVRCGGEGHDRPR